MIPVVRVDSLAPDLLQRIDEVRGSGAAALVLPPGALPGPVTAPDGTGIVVRTSGSTGAARHVALSWTAIEAAVRASLERLGGTEGQRWALALPTHHIAGLLVLLRARALGPEAVIVDRPGDPVALAGAEAEHIAIVPTQLARCLRAEVELHRFRTVLVGGGPTDAGLRAAALSAGVPLVETYGATETCGGCVYEGTPLDGVRIRVEAGSILVSGRVLALAVLDRAPNGWRPFPDGWFRTGDVGRLVEERLVVDGRADDVAVSGGLNVPLAAVAAALRTAPGVRDAAAVAVPDPEWGMLVRAVVVAAMVDPQPRLETLRDHVAATLPRSHAPRQLLVVDELPRDDLGKLSRAAAQGLADARPTEALT